jgi:hypothetical protein
MLCSLERDARSKLSNLDDTIDLFGRSRLKICQPPARSAG